RILTAQGRGAIAVVRVWGETAVAVVDAVFHPAGATSLAGSRAGRLRVGRAGLGQGDEGVAVRLPGAVPTVEIQCHGGPAAVAAVVAALEAAGARPWHGEEPGPDPGGDPIRAQALADLAQAPTLRTAEILLDQAQGALRQELVRLSSELDRGAESVLAGIDALIHRAAVGLRPVARGEGGIAGR